MHAVNTLSNLRELTPEQATQWVAAALAEALALRQHDSQLFPTADDALALLEAQELQTAWRHWADDAEALLQRIALPTQSQGRVNGLSELQDAIGRCRAMLQITPESHTRAIEQSRRGDVVNIEEVRRELRNRAG
jgi:hypothetical protein